MNNVNLRKFGQVSNNGSKTIVLITIETQGSKNQFITLESWEVVLFVAPLMFCQVCWILGDRVFIHYMQMTELS